MDNTQGWEKTASQKRVLRDQVLKPYMVGDTDQRIPQVQNADRRSRLDYNSTIQDITDISSVPILLDLLDQGKFTAEQVLLAYIKRYCKMNLGLKGFAERQGIKFTFIC